MEISWTRREAQVVDTARGFRMSVEILFHMWRSAESTDAVSEMFFLHYSLCAMRVVSTHDCMRLWHSYPFFLTLADFFASTKIALIFTSHDGTFGLSSSWWWMLVDFFPPIFSTNLEGWNVFRWLVHDWISFQKQVPQVPKKRFNDHFSRPFARTYLLVVEIITKNHQFKGTTWNPRSQRCINGRLSIGWWFLIFA